MLTRESLFFRIEFNVTDRAMDVVKRIEKHNPFPAGKGLRLFAKGMNATVTQRGRRSTFELDHQLVRIESMCPYDQVDMIGQHRAGVNNEPGFPSVLAEPGSHGLNLRGRKLDGGTLESRLGGQTLLNVVRPMCYRTSFGGFGCRTLTKQFPGANERRPRAPRIVGKPEAVSPENNVIGDHAVIPLAARHSASETSGH